MAELSNRIRIWFRGPSSNLRNRERAARNQLQGHIDTALLEGFIRKDLSASQHSEIVGHLNHCSECQEAIAVVLLARDDPSAAVNIVLEREKRVEERGPWWRVALRWTGITFALFVLGFLLYLLPTADQEGSFLGRILKMEKSGSASGSGDYSAQSETSSGGWFASTLSVYENEAKSADEKEKKKGPVKQISPDWNTGPAPYVGHVEGMPKLIEVEIPKEQLDKPDPKAPTNVSSASSGPETEAKTGTPRAVTRNRLVITDQGELMRTTDGGNTWRVITIKRGLAFRALAVSGKTIWAAGQEGALYRSPDAANNWQQVLVKYRGAPLTASIEQIRFADEQHGQFVTSDGDVWITVNGGNGWVLSLRHQPKQ